MDTSISSIQPGLAVSGWVPLEVLSPNPDGEAPPWLHLVPGETPLAFVVQGSRLFRVSAEFFAELAANNQSAHAELRHLAAQAPQPHLVVSADSEPTAVSLNVAQACNLGCGYCYADEGRFAGRARLMPLAVALSAVDRLLSASAGRRVTLGFIGGEPFLNREVLRATVEYAGEQAAARGVPIGYSVTTNGTLLDASDLAFLRRHAFAVTVSLDGAAETHDRYRRTRSGGGSYAAVCAAIAPLLADPGGARVAARATIARSDLRVAERVDALADLGFTDVGVSPLRTSPRPELAFQPDDWPLFLTEMTRAADREWRRVRGGGQFRFSNLATALREIHRGSCRPLPCGAAAGYVSMSAEGGVYTCHRTIDDPRFALGNGWPSAGARQEFLTARHVDRQEPCRSCWARYLCGGGCHAEVIAAGRHGCDFIRGWLEYCLRLYDEVLDERQDLLAEAQGATL